MPSAATTKSEKPVSTEAADNSPIRQIITILEHKIRNLEKRKSKLTSYRDLQKAGKELNADQKVAVAKYDEVAQTLEFARDLSKQVTAIATAAERDAKKQAKKEAFVRYTLDSKKIREVLLILDCLNQMGNSEAREDFLNGTNGAIKLTEEDLKILDDLYPEVTPKHELNEEGQSGFQSHTIKAADHLYAIIDGKPKEVLGTTYAHIKQLVTAVHESGYFEKSTEIIAVEVENCDTNVEEEPLETPIEETVDPNVVPSYVAPTVLPVPPAPAVVPTPAYPLRPIPPITLQEVEHAYFSQQYLQRRPISEVIGSQNFYFLQESEIDSPVGTPQPPPILNQPSPPAPIPTQTFTNPHYVQMPGAHVDEAGAMPLPPQPHFPPHPEHAHGHAHPHAHAHAHAHAHVHAGYPPAPPQQVPAAPLPPATAPHVPQQVLPEHSQAVPEEQCITTPIEDKTDDDWKENSRSPENDDGNERKTQGQGDGHNRYRRYGRGGNRPNGYRGRGAFQNRQNNDGYHSRHSGEYQNRSNKDGYQSRQYNDNYQNRHGKDGYHNRGSNDAYYGNGDSGESHQQTENGRERYDGTQSYQGGYKGRGRGGGAGRGTRGAVRGHAGHAPSRAHYTTRKQESND